MALYSKSYIELLKQGPLPGQIDPWAELGHYFQQIHSEMISHLLSQIRPSLLSMGYFAGRETSLQIAERREPDIHIRRRENAPSHTASLDYLQAAEVALAEPGVLLEGTEPELDALFIKARGSSELVTVVEIISPDKKTYTHLSYTYIERRNQLLEQGTHVVEIDLTRSIKRVVDETLVDRYPYHVAVHLHDQPSRFIGIAFAEPLKRCALPLRSEVIAVELQAAYEYAYRQPPIAVQILEEIGYHDSTLPFPTLLTESQRQTVVQAAQNWLAELKRLQVEAE